VPERVHEDLRNWRAIANGDAFEENLGNYRGRPTEGLACCNCYHGVNGVLELQDFALAQRSGSFFSAGFKLLRKRFHILSPLGNHSQRAGTPGLTSPPSKTIHGSGKELLRFTEILDDLVERHRTPEVPGASDDIVFMAIVYHYCLDQGLGCQSVRQRAERIRRKAQRGSTAFTTTSKTVIELGHVKDGGRE
jgi:hypothetical protein